MTTQYAAGQRLPPSMLNQLYAVADTTSRTITAASFSNISSQETIPGGEAVTDSVYCLSCGGTGEQGSTAQSLSFRANTIGGSGLNAVNIASGFCATSTAFRWWARMTLFVASAGSAGNIVGFLEGGVLQNGGTGGSTTFLSHWGAGSDSTVTVNTAANWGIEIDAEWGSTTGTPGITCTATLFQKTS